MQLSSLKTVIRAGDITEHAKEFIKLYGDKYLDCGEDERKQALIDYALEKNISALKTDLENIESIMTCEFRKPSSQERRGNVCN